jgi:hypothetical protein
LVSDRAQNCCEYCLIPENLTLDVIRLYHPRQDQWQENFQIETSNGVIYPLTAIGRVTIQLLKINRSAYLPYRQMLAQAKMLYK